MFFYDSSNTIQPELKIPYLFFKKIISTFGTNLISTKLDNEKRFKKYL